jgi:hypothetical protein
MLTLNPSSPMKLKNTKIPNMKAIVDDNGNTICYVTAKEAQRLGID